MATTPPSFALLSFLAFGQINFLASITFVVIFANFLILFQTSNQLSFSSKVDLSHTILNHVEANTLAFFRYKSFSFPVGILRSVDFSLGRTRD